jgi:hypothetical protein
MPLEQGANGFFAVDQFAAPGLSEPVFEFLGDVGAIVGQPLLVFVKHLNSKGDEFICGLIGAPLHIVLNERLHLWL